MNVECYCEKTHHLHSIDPITSCNQMQDQMWMHLDDDLDNLERIAVEGPSVDGDVKRIRAVMLFVVGTLYLKRDLREVDDGTS